MMFIPILPPSGEKVELTDCGTGFLHITCGWIITLYSLACAVVITENFIHIQDIWKEIGGLVIILGYVIHTIIHVSRYDDNGKLKKPTKLIAEANKFFDEFIKRQLLEDQQLDEEITNYWS